MSNSHGKNVSNSPNGHAAESKFSTEHENKLVILVVSACRLWHIGDRSGTPALYNMLKGYVDRGHETHFITCGKYPDSSCVYDGIHVHKLKLTEMDWLRGNVYGLSKVLWVLFIVFATVKALQISKRCKPSVVYGYESQGAPVAWVIGKLYRIPVVIRFQGFWHRYASLGRLKFFILYFEHVVALKVPADLLIITNDGTYGDRIAEYFGVPREKVRYWMNGVDREEEISNFDVDQFKKELDIVGRYPILLTVSRLIREKRVDRVVTAIPLVVHNYPNAVFLIVGDGDERKNLENLSKKLGVESHVKFVGSVDHNKITQYLYIADLFVYFSDFSNVCNPVLEAMACGKCIVTLNSGATSELIRNGKNGVLLKYSDLNRIPNVIAHLLRDRHTREELGNNARKYVLEHVMTWEERIEKEVNVVIELVHQRRC